MFQKLDRSIPIAPESGEPSVRPAASATPAPVAPYGPPSPAESARRSLRGPTLDTVIGIGAHLEGHLAAEGTIRVHGSAHGELISSEAIVIEERGRVTGTIMAAQVVVAGQLEGQVRGNGRVELRSTARMQGELHTNVLVIQEGAAFDGRASMES